MNFRSAKSEPVALTCTAGVAICVTHTPSEMMHVGLIYLNSDDDIRFIHLADHLDLQEDKTLTNEYYWSNCNFLGQPGYELYAEHMANLLEAISKRRDIPYGLDDSGVSFNPDGTYVSSDAAHGLTCATFIAAVFQSAGLPVVQLETWERRSADDIWRRIIIGAIGRRHPERSEEIAGSPGSYRLRPDEVAVASARIHRPLTFIDAQSAVVPLRNLLFPVASTESTAMSATTQRSEN